MRRFLTTVKNTAIKSYGSDSNYLTSISTAHANNLYNDDDKAITESLKSQGIKIKQVETIKPPDNKWLTDKSIAHANSTVQDEDKLILESIDKQKTTPTLPDYSATGC